MTSARTSTSGGAYSQQKLQRMASGPPARFPRRRHSYPRSRSCLRKTSAYCGDSMRAGSRLEELSATRMVTVRFGDEPKKSLSFADQHGFRLELLREYSPSDAPTEFCDLEEELRALRRRSGSLDSWVADSVARQHLLSVCVVSCSILGAAIIGLRQASK